MWKSLLDHVVQHVLSTKEIENIDEEEVSSGMTEESAAAIEYQVAGFKDGYKKYFKKPTDALKQELTKNFVDEGVVRP